MFMPKPNRERTRFDKVNTTLNQTCISTPGTTVRKTVTLPVVSERFDKFNCPLERACLRMTTETPFPSSSLLLLPALWNPALGLKGCLPPRRDILTRILTVSARAVSALSSNFEMRRYEVHDYCYAIYMCII